MCSYYIRFKLKADILGTSKNLTKAPNILINLGHNMGKNPK